MRSSLLGYVHYATLKIEPALRTKRDRHEICMNDVPRKTGGYYNASLISAHVSIPHRCELVISVLTETTRRAK